MSRSADLTRGRRWNVFVFVLVAVFLQMIPAMITSIMLVLTGAIDSPNPSVGNVTLIVAWLVGLAVSLFWVVSPIVVYFSLRAERDGFDVEQLASLVDEIGQRAGAPRRS
jgi:hypothetical protein